MEVFRNFNLTCVASASVAQVHFAELPDGREVAVKILRPGIGETIEQDTALLYGVNAGGCGTPIASLANLIGADLYLRGRAHRAPFWRLFLAVSFTLLAVAIALSLAL